MEFMHFFIGLPAVMGISALIWEIVNETIEEDEAMMSQERFRPRKRRLKTLGGKKWTDKREIPKH